MKIAFAVLLGFLFLVDWRLGLQAVSIICIGVGIVLIVHGLKLLLCISKDDWERLRGYHKAAKAYNNTWRKLARNESLTEEDMAALGRGTELYRAGKLERPIGSMGFRVAGHERDRVLERGKISYWLSSSRPQ